MAVFVDTTGPNRAVSIASAPTASSSCSSLLLTLEHDEDKMRRRRENRKRENVRGDISYPMKKLAAKLFAWCILRILIYIIGLVGQPRPTMRQNRFGIQQLAKPVGSERGWRNKRKKNAQEQICRDNIRIGERKCSVFDLRSEISPKTRNFQ